MSERYDVIVIGAGIVGAACARACAEAGLSVVVLERGTVAGGGTTATGMGHVVVMDDSDAQFQLSAYSRTLWQEFAQTEATAEALEYDACGTVWVAADAVEMEEVERKYAFYRERDIHVERWTARTLYREEPHLRADLKGGLCVYGDAVIYPPVATRVLLDAARQTQAEIRMKAVVKSIDPSGCVHLDDGTEFQAEAVINATGCAAPVLTPELPIRKRKGHLVITDTYPHFAQHQMIELGYLKSAHTLSTESVAFNLQPRKSGQLLIGSSRQFDEETTSIDFKLLQRMLDRALHFIPELADMSVLRCWTGFRPATPDKLPYIGPHPKQEKLWLATGHEGLGITTALATGQIIADLLQGREPAIPVEPYLPQRVWQKEVCDA